LAVSYHSYAPVRSKHTPVPDVRLARSRKSYRTRQLTT